MTKKRTTYNDGGESPPGRSSEDTPLVEAVYPLTFRGGEIGLKTALQAFAKKSRRSLNSTILTILEEYAAANGIWPEPPAAG
jgi:hypothetical protein